jgi:hypothetical protein
MMCIFELLLLPFLIRKKTSGILISSRLPDALGAFAISLCALFSLHWRRKRRLYAVCADYVRDVMTYSSRRHQPWVSLSAQQNK